MEGAQIKGHVYQCGWKRVAYKPCIVKVNMYIV